MRVPAAALAVMPAFLSVFLSAFLITAHPAPAQVMDLLTAPKSLVDRAIEARSFEDIKKDNEIVIKVNEIMADLGTIKASTEIYEQRLLVTGIFDDRKLYDRFETAVRKVKGVKKLYWHVRYMTKAEQKAHAKEMLDWGDALLLDARVGINLTKTRGIADVNYKVAVDAFGTVYLLGRARSQEEMKKVLYVTRHTKGARKVVNYAYVKP